MDTNEREFKEKPISRPQRNNPRDSRFAYLDNVFYSPLCLLLGLAVTLVALN
jgi:hypothetical protein